MKTIHQSFINKVLTPYRQSATYLKSASVENQDSKNIKDILATGEFSIGTSCYIDDTGHFNAVEYNICFNQLAYVFIAHCVTSGAISEFSDYTLEDFFKNQLSKMLICKISSKFPKMLDTKRFYGKLRIISLKKLGSLVVINFSCDFNDDKEGKSSGEVTCALVL